VMPTFFKKMSKKIKIFKINVLDYLKVNN